MGKLSEWLEKKGLRKWFRKDNLIILILSGVLLMIVAWPMDRKKESAGTSAGSEKESDAGWLTLDGSRTGESTGLGSDSAEGAAGFGSGAGDAADLGSGVGDVAGLGSGAGDAASLGSGSENGQELAQYVASLEKRLESLLSGMEGVGEVRVMITLRSSGELVLEKDRSETRSETTEKDAEGGSRSIDESENGESTVFASSGSAQSPYVVKTLTPRVEGVVVLAQGAGTARVSSDLSEAVQALFGIDAHKVKVIRMKQE